MVTRALITGSGGLIGTWLLRHLMSSTVEAIPVTSREADLLAPGAAIRLVEQVQPDVVIHLAWCASGSPNYRHSADNFRWVNATVELHAACRRIGATLLATGTMVDDSTNPLDAYSVAKSALRARLTAEIEAGDIGWLRPAYVFDEQARRPALLAYALNGRDRAESVALQTPERSHDFVHASDVALAIVTVVEHRLMGLIPIGSGTTRAVAELVSALGVRWHRSPLPTAQDHQHESDVADVRQLTGLGWRPVRTDEVFGGSPSGYRGLQGEEDRP